MKNLLIAFCFLFSSTTSAGDIESMLKQNNCVACHTLDRKLVGPSFKSVAEKYREVPNASDLLVKKIQSGGKGVWGNMNMPPYKDKLSIGSTNNIVNWILSK